MSLDRQQMAATADDLRTNMQRAALSTEELGTWVHLEPNALESVLAMDGTADPATVWAVRDAIEKTLNDEGDAGDWSVLTEANRVKAQTWFPLRDLPRR